MAHSSGTFITKALVDRTRRKQRELFISPIGDIGYVGTLLNTENIYYLDLPLAVIGEGHPRDMDGALRGQRHRWDRFLKYLDNTPLKSASFVNMCVESQLKVLYRNSAEELYDSRLRPSFFYQHLKSVISDSPWTFGTIKDLVACVSHLIVSICRFPSYIFNKNTVKLIYEDSVLTLSKGRGDLAPHGEGCDLRFKNIDEFTKWIRFNSVLDSYIG
jgi:hypothetical protein